MGTDTTHKVNRFVPVFPDTNTVRVGTKFTRSFRCDIHVVFYKLNTKYNYQSKHNKNYCIMFYNMFYNYMFRPFSLGHLQVVYTRP